MELTRRQRYYREERANRPHRDWARNAINGHRKKGHTVLISIDEMEAMALEAKTCPICGVEFRWGKNGRDDRSTSPSIDRIDNECMLTPDNVQIICYHCNHTKCDRSMEEFVDYYEMVAEKFGGEA